jgi:hypothetical protein
MVGERVDRTVYNPSPATAVGSVRAKRDAHRRMNQSKQRRGGNASAFIARIKLKDGEKFQAYAAQTKAIFADFGAELIMRG